MKFSCDASVLKQALLSVSRAIPNKPSHPILANTLLEIEDGVLSLTGFDLSIGIKTSVTVNDGEDGSVCVPKLFTTLVSTLEGLVEIYTEHDKVFLVAKSGKYEVQGMSKLDYPELPTIDDTPSLIPVSHLVDGLKAVSFSASTDESKQVLTGIRVTAHPEYLEFASTDGHRLSVTIIPFENTLEEFEMTIPIRAVGEIDRLLQNSKSETLASVSFNQFQLNIEVEGSKLTTRLLEGAYPNYNQLLPKAFKTQMTIPRKDLVSSLDRIAVLADQKNNVVKFTLNEGDQTLALSVEAADIGSGQETLSAQISGGLESISFNVTYVIEGLKSMNTTDVQFEFNTATSPVVITPLGGSKMKYLVMPCQSRG